MQALIVALLLVQTLHTSRVASEPLNVVCGLSIVGYRFVGVPQQRFEYDGETYEIGMNGYIELIADPRLKTFRVAGDVYPLPASPADAFGFVKVSVNTQILRPQDPNGR